MWPNWDASQWSAVVQAMAAVLSLIATVVLLEITWRLTRDSIMRDIEPRIDWSLDIAGVPFDRTPDHLHPEVADPRTGFRLGIENIAGCDLADVRVRIRYTFMVHVCTR